jgi:hypothetical protein
MTRPLRSAAKAALRQWGVTTASLRPLPDFLILGTKRGGTTSLWNHLLEHPLVLPMFPAVQKLKSPHYFYWHYERGERWYRSHFATRRRRCQASHRGGGTALTGEASPYYLYHPYTPERVRALLPAAKLIIMLRDPVARAYSHYWERINEGVETLSFDDAIRVEDERLKGEVERMDVDPLYYSRPHDYFTYRDRGVYLPQLERWFGHFPREQALIIRSEDFYADRQRVFDEICAFLGLPQHTLKRPKRFNYRPAAPMSAETRSYLTEFFEPHNRALYDYLGRDFEWASPDEPR